MSVPLTSQGWSEEIPGRNGLLSGLDGLKKNVDPAHELQTELGLKNLL